MKLSKNKSVVTPVVGFADVNPLAVLLTVQELKGKNLNSVSMEIKLAILDAFKESMLNGKGDLLELKPSGQEFSQQFPNIKGTKEVRGRVVADMVASGILEQKFKSVYKLNDMFVELFKAPAFDKVVIEILNEKEEEATDTTDTTSEQQTDVTEVTDTKTKTKTKTKTETKSDNKDNTKPPLTEDEERAIYEARINDNLSYDKLAKMFKRSKSTITKVVKKYEALEKTEEKK